MATILWLVLDLDLILCLCLFSCVSVHSSDTLLRYSLSVEFNATVFPTERCQSEVRVQRGEEVRLRPGSSL